MMSRWVVGAAVAAIGIVAGTGCPSSASSFECSTNGDCGDMGRCEVTGFCSFPDGGCPSQYRYGEFAEALSNQCVVDESSSTDGTTTPASSSASSTDPSTTAAGSSTTEPSTTTIDPSTTSDDTDTTDTTDAGDSSSSSSSSDTTSSETTMGDDCLIDDFDEVPGPPTWFTFATGLNPVMVQGSSVILDTTVDDGMSSAIIGVRTVDPADLSNGYVELVVEQVPTLAQITSAFTVNDEVAANPNSIGFGFVNGNLRVQDTVENEDSLLASMPVAPSEYPLTLRIEVVAGELVMNVQGTTINEDMHSQEAPAWFDDVYISFDSGNPTSNDPMGVSAAGIIAMCPGPQ